MSTHTVISPELEDTDLDEIARLIREGYTSGYLDREDGVRIAWSLTATKFAFRR